MSNVAAYTWKADGPGLVGGLGTLIDPSGRRASLNVWPSGNLGSPSSRARVELIWDEGSVPVRVTNLHGPSTTIWITADVDALTPDLIREGVARYLAQEYDITDAVITVDI